jgi:PHD/YefM family antitoxin component YafN of YafNO toxin-antitoxin module
LKKIVAEAQNLFKIFISSRDHADIVIKLADMPNIYIDSADNYEDIKQFFAARVHEAIEDQRLLSSNVSASLRDEIISALAEKAKGTSI